MTQHRYELKDFFDGMKPVQPTSIDDVFKTDFVRGTLVRISPKSGLEGIEVHPGEHLPPLFDYAKGIITALKGRRKASHRDRQRGSQIVCDGSKSQILSAARRRDYSSSRMERLRCW